MYYKFKLYNEKGQILVCDSLKNDRFYLLPSPGMVEKQSYDYNSKYFSLDIHTIMPYFGFIWVRKNKTMILEIDQATEYKTIWLDSLYFSEGKMFITGKEGKLWTELPGLKVKQYKTDTHLIITNPSLFAVDNLNPYYFTIKDSLKCIFGKE